MTLAGRVVAHLEVASDGPSMFLHVKLVDVHADGRAHALLFGQEVVAEPRRRGTPRSTWATRAIACARAPAATARRVERFPRRSSPPRHRRESVGRDVTQTNRQTLATGGATPSHVSLTVVAGR